MELPVDEEDDEQVMGIPEPLKVNLALLLACKVSHDSEYDCHNPSCGTRAGGKVHRKEIDEMLAWTIAHRGSQLVEVHHMSDNVD